MGKKLNESDEIVLILDDFGAESKRLYTSLNLAKVVNTTIVLNDNGFLPDEIESIYSVFCGDFSEKEELPGRPLFFNEIKVPALWEIKSTNNSGEVFDKSHKRANIFFAQGEHARVVEVVDWLDDRGVVRYSDHYNKYGAMWARTAFNANGQRVNKSYFDADGKECVVENYVTGDIIVNVENKIFFFENKTKLAAYIIEMLELSDRRVVFNSLSYPYFVSQELKIKGKTDILYWQEPAGNEIPGNMRGILDGTSNRARKVLVSDRLAYERLIELGANPAVVQPLGYVFDYRRKTNHASQALILTNSDNIECVNEIVRALPNVQFHIAAITEMSAKLHAVGRESNVILYPNIKTAVAKELFNECDILLDINYYTEILDACNEAFLQNMLLLGFSDTVHKKSLVAPEHIAKKGDFEYLIKVIKTIISDNGIWDECIKQQQAWALSEDIDSVREIIVS